VCLLVLSPLAKGLFRRSIQQSGECAFGIIVPNTPEQGAAIAQTVLDAAGADSFFDLANATRFPVEAIAPISSSLNVGWMTLDGWVMPEQPRVRINDPSNINPKDMIVGSNSYDSALAVVFPPEIYMPMASNMEAEIRGVFGDESAATRVLEAYAPAKYDGNQVAAYSQYWGDHQFRCPSRHFASVVAGKVDGDVFLYNYAYRSSFDPNVANGLVSLAGIDDPMWASHAADVIMVFGTFDAAAEWFNEANNVTTGFAPQAEDLAMSEEMMARWANFARSGNPNIGGYVGWDPVPVQDESSQTGGATAVPSFILKKEGGTMTSVPEKVEQCSALYPSPTHPTEDNTATTTPGSSAAVTNMHSSFTWRQCFVMLTALVTGQAFLPVL